MESLLLCKRCNVEKSTSDFPKGNKVSCKACLAKARKEQLLAIKNAEGTRKCRICEQEKECKRFHTVNVCLDCRYIKEKDTIANYKAKVEELGVITCSICKEEKSPNEFRKDRITEVCNSCSRKKLDNWREDNKEVFLAHCKKYRDKAESKLKRNETSRNRYASDPIYKLRNRLRYHYRRAILLGGKKYSNTLNVLGCSLKFLRKWFEFNFEPEMTWENHGTYWDIDHITPLSSFSHDNLKNNQECFGWKNLCPLEKIANLEKKDKILPEVINYYKERAEEFLKLYPNPMMEITEEDTENIEENVNNAKDETTLNEV
jgi:hypothetical protein